MPFPSFAFIFGFLPVVLVATLWAGRRSPHLAIAGLGVASLAFYAAWNATFVLLLAGSVAFNFVAGRWLVREGRHARLKLAAAIAVNLAVLAYFKYANFFLAELRRWFAIDVPSLDVILPLGISFFTFTQIAYLVDVHRREAREYRATHYLLFVTFFPHLVAGPLLHHKQLMPQFADPRAFRFDSANVAAGLSIFVWGLAKKVLLADPLSTLATPVFEAVAAGSTPRLFEAWLGALAYTLQLYFDFSGYSDMAIGLSLMFNVRLPLNFDSPYKSASIIEFWRRWHITLSTFLRDYVYIPLGGNRHGSPRRYVNLMTTMLLGGLWHGAAWTFVLWGALHGGYLLVNHAWRHLAARAGWTGGGVLARFAAAALTFCAVVVGWVFFRADSIGSAATLIRGMLGGYGVSLPADAQPLLATWLGSDVGRALVYEGLAPVTVSDGRIAIAQVAIGLAIVWLMPNARQVFAACSPTWEDWTGTRARPVNPSAIRWKPNTGWAILLAGVFFLCLFQIATAGVSEFIYSQF